MKKKKDFSSKYVERVSQIEYYINLLVDKIIYFFREFNKLIKNKNGEKIIRIVLNVFIILLFAWLLKLPFVFVQSMGAIILRSVSSSFYSFSYPIWGALIRFGYYLCATIFLYIFISRLVSGENNINGKSDEDSKTLEKTNYAAMLFKPFVYLIKLIIILVTLPIWCFVILFSVILGLLVCLLFQGVYFVSPFLITIGAILVCSSIIGLVNYFAFGLEEK